MSFRKDLTQIDLAKAINQTVENLFLRWTKDKVLTVQIQTTANDFDSDKKVFKTYMLIFYRPMNYTFVGVIDGGGELDEHSDIEYLSYHDSCWRYDGTEHYIQKMADTIEKEFDFEKDKPYVRNCFGLNGYKILNGNLNIDSNKRTAKFVPSINN